MCVCVCVWKIWRENIFEDMCYVHGKPKSVEKKGQRKNSNVFGANWRVHFSMGRYTTPELYNIDKIRKQRTSKIEKKNIYVYITPDRAKTEREKKRDREIAHAAVSWRGNHIGIFILYVIIFLFLLHFRATNTTCPSYMLLLYILFIKMVLVAQNCICNCQPGILNRGYKIRVHYLYDYFLKRLLWICLRISGKSEYE